MLRRANLVAVCVSVCAATISPLPERAAGQCLMQRLTTDDEIPGLSFTFARSVAASDDRVVVTGGWSDTFGQSLLFAYVYQRIAYRWVLDQRLSPSEGSFRSRAVISGDRVAVASTKQQTILIFRRDENGWIEEASLTPWDDPPCCNGFGSYSPFVITGDLLVAAAQHDTGWGPGTGAVYVFRRKGTVWVPEQKLIASDALNAGEGQFARTLAVDGDFILVGDPPQAGDVDDLGRVYPYSFDGARWVEEDILTADETVLGYRFGYEIALSGPRALIGGPAVHVFERKASGWEQAGFFSHGGEPALTDSLALMGNSNHNNHTGAVHLFSRSGSTWSLVRTILPRDVNSYLFGRVVALTDTHAFIAGSGQLPGQRPGIVHVYALTGPCQSLLDYSGFQRCFSGSMGGAIPICQAFDMDGDEDVDFDDYLRLLETFSGP